MATTTALLPDGTATFYNRGFAIVGSPSPNNFVKAVNDGFTTTGIRKPVVDTYYDIYYNVASTTANITTAIPWKIACTATLSQGASGLTKFYVELGVNSSVADQVSVVSKSVSGTKSIEAVTGSYILFSDYLRVADAGRQTQFTAANMQSVVDGLLVRARDASPGSSRATIWELGLSIQTTTIPTTAIASIGGDTAASYAITMSRPLIDWTYTQTDNIAQTYWEVAIFSASTADPTSDTNLLWRANPDTRGITTDGVTSYYGLATDRAITSIYPDIDLVNGTTPWIYIRTGFRYATGGRGGDTIFYSTWVNSGATTVAFTPPTRPTLTATWDSTNQKVTLSAVGAAFATGTQTCDIQRSEDAGVTWEYVRGAEAVSIDASPYTLSVSDYESKRTGTVLYRARAVGVLTSGGSTVTGLWTSSVSVTPTSDSNHWLKCPEDSTLNVGNLAIMANPDFEIEEQTEVLRPLGRTDAIVVSGAIGGSDGSFELYVTSAQWTAVKALLTTQATLLWQDSFNENRYIRIINRSWHKQGKTSLSHYFAKINFIEVSSP
jgi:hypothetical protein